MNVMYITFLKKNFFLSYLTRCQLIDNEKLKPIRIYGLENWEICMKLYINENPLIMKSSNLIVTNVKKNINNVYGMMLKIHL